MRAEPARAGIGARIACDAAGALPPVDPADWDLCLTRAPAPPRPWVSVADPAAEAARCRAAMAAQPDATVALMALLRDGGGSRRARLVAESRAFSALLSKPGFARWLAARGPVVVPPEPPEPVVFARQDDAVTLTLASPASHNALSAHLREALNLALETCLVDPTRPAVRLESAGRAFSTGGALWEFGLSTDLAAAHGLRVARAPVRRVWALRGRGSVHVAGAAIGAGAEIAAGFARVTAGPGAWFQLPELAMGLVPGAGGTVTVPDRIGRHRALWAMVSGRRIDARTACDWGLVDALEP